jgi:hypothetical protein
MCLTIRFKPFGGTSPSVSKLLRQMFSQSNELRIEDKRGRPIAGVSF